MKDIAVVSVPHTGSHYAQAFLKHLGFGEVDIIHIDSWGLNDLFRSNITTAVVPLRHPSLVYSSLRKRAYTAEGAIEYIRNVWPNLLWLEKKYKVVWMYVGEKEDLYTVANKLGKVYDEKFDTSPRDSFGDQVFEITKEELARISGFVDFWIRTGDNI